MVVPHSKSKPVALRVPFLALAALAVLWGFGTVYVVSIGVKTAEYYTMSNKLSYLTGQFGEVKSTLTSLKKAEVEFNRLLGGKSKKKILEDGTSDDSGSLDMELLKKQVAEAMSSVTEIRQYIDKERSVYRATPRGWPVHGGLSSPFGTRPHPRTGIPTFHSGVDIRTPPGTPVKATADGIVSVSGWAGGNGNVVVVEHGKGFTSAYAHNTRNLVRVGQKIKRGDTIALSGSTGMSTGPHVHYEVWKGGAHVNPIHYLEEKS
jgi:murein DD-endopeptidase MepM/ murein hydrolase activator NlpD